MLIKINHNMIFEDKISVRIYKYTKNIIYFNNVMTDVHFHEKLKFEKPILYPKTIPY